RRRTKAIADKLGLDFDFFPAVSKYDEKTLDEFEGNYQNNHKACFISHYRVFQSIAENDYSSTLILEDDVDMEMDIIPIITGIHDILPTDWETLFIGHCGLDSRGEILGESHGIGLFKSNHPLCTHAYAVSSAGVHKFLKEFTVADSPIDVKFYFEIKKGNINSYSLNPAPIVQARSPSDLTPGEEPDEDLRNSTLRFLGLRK
ncbi:2493_t:CDS:1, partial [Acaulospora colombiana]